MSRPREAVSRVRGRVADGVGLTELRRLGERLRSLEVAVAENARLAVPLEEHVTRVEAALLRALETRRGPDVADDD